MYLQRSLPPVCTAVRMPLLLRVVLRRSVRNLDGPAAEALADVPNSPAHEPLRVGAVVVWLQCVPDIACVCSSCLARACPLSFNTDGLVATSPTARTQPLDLAESAPRSCLCFFREFVALQLRAALVVVNRARSRREHLLADSPALRLVQRAA